MQSLVANEGERGLAASRPWLEPQPRGLERLAMGAAKGRVSVIVAAVEDTLSPSVVHCSEVKISTVLQLRYMREAGGEREKLPVAFSLVISQNVLFQLCCSNINLSLIHI